MLFTVRRALVVVVLLLAALPARPALAQEAGGARGAAPRMVRVFLDCEWYCDFDHLRTETPWVEYVRDRTVADVHLLVTQLGTGAGGAEYTLAFVGQERFAGRVDTLVFTSPPNVTEDARREGLTRTIQLGLVPFVMRTAQAQQLRLSFEEGAGAPRVAPARDPWNAWVFSFGASGSVDREEQQDELSFDGSFSARRITEAWKFGVSGGAEYERETFDVEDRSITTTQEEFDLGTVAVRSLGPHWGFGAQMVVSSSTFANTQLAVRVAPAIEYSVFPYEEATRRQLVLQYSVGVSSFDYREETIFERLSETRPTQALVVGYDVRQPWGSADVELETANFLDDFEKFRVEFDAGLDLRLFQGLSLDVGGSASLIRDQLAIVKRDATPEEILLQRRALLTDYRYSAYVGLSYTFGSIFNSVVNPRFGTGPGSILR